MKKCNPEKKVDPFGIKMYEIRVADPDGVYGDPDPTFEKKPKPGSDPTLEKNWIKILPDFYLINSPITF